MKRFATLQKYEGKLLDIKHKWSWAAGYESVDWHELDERLNARIGPKMTELSSILQEYATTRKSRI